jgi:uncharacterized protein YbjQ (UPF0145 family)
MWVTTTFSSGLRIREYKGVVRGIIVRANHRPGVRGGLKNIIGGRSVPMPRCVGPSRPTTV